MENVLENNKIPKEGNVFHNEHGYAAIWMNMLNIEISDMYIFADIHTAKWQQIPYPEGGKWDTTFEKKK